MVSDRTNRSMAANGRSKNHGYVLRVVLRTHPRFGALFTHGMTATRVR